MINEKEIALPSNFQTQNYFKLEIQTKLISNFSFSSFIYGYIAGFSGIVTSHPFDTMKTRIQEGKKINFNIKNLYRGVSIPLSYWSRP